jgi:hypothetical protein
MGERKKYLPLVALVVVGAPSGYAMQKKKELLLTLTDWWWYLCLGCNANLKVTSEPTL